MAGRPIKGTVKAGVTLTSSIPVIIGGLTSAGIVKPLSVNTDGTVRVV